MMSRAVTIGSDFQRDRERPTHSAICRHSSGDSRPCPDRGRSGSVRYPVSGMSSVMVVTPGSGKSTREVASSATASWRGANLEDGCRFSPLVRLEHAVGNEEDRLANRGERL